MPGAVIEEAARLDTRSKPLSAGQNSPVRRATARSAVALSERTDPTSAVDVCCSVAGWNLSQSESVVCELQAWAGGGGR